jgi:hypothetical protein
MRAPWTPTSSSRPRSTKADGSSQESWSAAWPRVRACQWKISDSDIFCTFRLLNLKFRLRHNQEEGRVQLRVLRALRGHQQTHGRVDPLLPHPQSTHQPITQTDEKLND